MPNKERKKLFIACDEAQHCCDKAQYNEASLVEKIKLSLHLLFCRTCQKYTSTNNKLTQLMKKEKVQSFDNNEKNELEKLFQQQIKQSD